MKLERLSIAISLLVIYNDFMKKYILSLDAGTTSSRAIVFSKEGEVVSKAQKEFSQIYPRPAWVEHDALEIWRTQEEVMLRAIEDAGCRVGGAADLAGNDSSCDADAEIAAIGITNQRETTVVWNRLTGEPIYNAIVWQCRRTADMIEKLREDGLSSYVQDTTGLIPDPYFSASKIAWILENVPGARDMAGHGELLFGTIDTWLVWNLTGGAVHVTDVTNASRTMLFDIHKLDWDEKLLSYFNIPRNMLPRVAMSSEVVGHWHGIPIAGMVGDQQGALFGNCCFSEGDVKNTYGTGAFALMNTGENAVRSKSGLVTTIACGLNGRVTYALEGSVFIAGAAIQWLRDEMKLLENAAESERCCEESIANFVTKNGAADGDGGGRAVSDGVYVVPAFSGLGAPYWNPAARGSIFGLTRGTSRNDFVRATVESLAFQSADLVRAMREDLYKVDSDDAPISSGLLSTLKVDGGACLNNYLMQFQADILGINVERPSCIETTALGAAYLAGLAVGFWTGLDEIDCNRKIDRTFAPDVDNATREKLLSGWRRAVKAAICWTEN